MNKLWRSDGERRLEEVDEDNVYSIQTDNRQL